MSSKRVDMNTLFAQGPKGPDRQEERSGTEPRAITVKTDRLLPNPHNPRDSVGDLEDLRSIAEIQRQSLLVVTRAAYLTLYPDEAEACRGIDYVVANGNRRQRAAEKWGRAELICVVNDSVAASRAALMRAAYDENVQRLDFDPIEDAKAVLSIVSEYATAKEAAAAEGWSETWISHRRSLLRLHPELQDQVRAKARTGVGLAVRTARELGSVKGIDGMTLLQQQEALQALLDTKAETAAAKKAERQAAKAEAKQRPAVQPLAEHIPAPAGSSGFSAENFPPAPQSAPAAAPAAREAAKAQPATPTAPVAHEPAAAAGQQPTAAGDHGFSAENPADLPVPSPRPSSNAEVQLDLRSVDWTTVEVEQLAEAVCQQSPMLAFKLAEALAARLQSVTQ
jgi:ParB family chromosome partitioning protein